MKDLKVSVPEEYVEQLGGIEAAEQELTRLSVLEMVRKGTISAGRGAEILNLPIYDFIQLMGDHGLDWYDQSEEELDAELKLLREL